MVAVLPIFIVFVVIAFFKVSELSLIPFIIKMIQTHILDETVKYQINVDHIDPADLAFDRSKLNEPQESTLDHKTFQLDDLIVAGSKNILK